MTGDVNAAIECAAMAGVDEVLVNDSHDGMRNILIEELHPKAQLVLGYTKPLSMMQGIDSSFDLAVFVGYHAMAAIAGYFGVPVGAVTGDDKIAKELSTLLVGIETAVVKEGIDRFSVNVQGAFRFDE